MTLEQFAEKAGVTLINSPIGYGGPYGYIEYGRSNSSTHGFKTKDAAYKAWLLETFGKRVAKTVLELLEKTLQEADDLGQKAIAELSTRVKRRPNSTTKAITIGLEALEANHEWHKKVRVVAGYEKSSFCEMNLAAICALAADLASRAPEQQEEEANANTK